MHRTIHNRRSRGPSVSDSVSRVPYFTAQPPRTARSRAVPAVHILSEDGDNAARGLQKPRIHADEVTPKRSGLSKLDQLLNGTTPQVDRPVLSPRSAPGVRRSREITLPASSRSAGKPVSRVNRTVRDKPTSHLASFSNEDSEEDPGLVLPEHEPLRSRPLHRLNLDDFKVNPKFSDHLGFAFRETVRKREARRCLPGCTREECCGEIRRFIAAGGLPADTSLSDDELTLQGYLGPTYARIIHNASADEKEKMLIEARAKAFADRHGKHRQAFERRATPPGFWRTDMPTTQEAEDDRERARQMERQKVEERWRDAMRGGGRYIFRDE